MLKLSKTGLIVAFCSTLLINQQIWAASSEQESLYNEEIQEINQVTLQAEEQRHEATKSRSSLITGWIVNAEMIAIGAILLVDPSAIKDSLRALVIPNLRAMFIGLGTELLHEALKNSVEYKSLEQVFEAAGKSGIPPHVFLVGKVTPGSVADVIKLAAQTSGTEAEVVYEPIHTPANLIVDAINQVTSADQRVNISMLTLAEVSSNSPTLDKAILNILPRINFVGIGRGYAHILSDRKSLHLSIINESGKTSSSQEINIAGFSDGQIIDVVRETIKNYRQENIAAFKKQALASSNTKSSEPQDETQVLKQPSASEVQTPSILNTINIQPQHDSAPFHHASPAR